MFYRFIDNYNIRPTNSSFPDDQNDGLLDPPNNTYNETFNDFNNYNQNSFSNGEQNHLHL